MTADSADLADKPVAVRVCYDGQEYVRDLALCRRTLRERQIEGARNMTAIARAIGVGTSTLTRFLNGTGSTTKDATDRIVAGLGLSFDAIHTRVSSDA